MPNQSDIDLANSQTVAMLAQNNISSAPETPVVPRRTIAEWSAMLAGTSTQTTTVWDPADLHPYGFSTSPYSMYMCEETPVFEPEPWENVYGLEGGIYRVGEEIEVQGRTKIIMVEINTTQAKIVWPWDIHPPIGRIRL